MTKFLSGAVKWSLAVFLIKKENWELLPMLAESLKFRNRKLLTFFFFFSCGSMCCVLVCECVVFAYVWTVVCVWICICRRWGGCESSACSSIAFFKAVPRGATQSSQTLLASTPSLLWGSPSQFLKLKLQAVPTVTWSLYGFWGSKLPNLVS